MFLIKVCLTTLFVIALYGSADAQLNRRFPDDFQFGSASAAYQVEGGWDADGKGESIWDRLAHKNPEMFHERQNGDVACDSYHKYKEDVQMLKAAGMDFYRFSISWSRVMPNGDASQLNEPGLQYYDNLINELLTNSIEPMVTMYHFDLPQPLQEIGGILNPEFVNYFTQYADVLFERYGDRVKTWITFNEPSIMCEMGYAEQIIAPYVYAPGVGHYLCAYHILLANAHVYELYQSNYKQREGRVGITLHCAYAWPKDATNATHVDAAERYMQFYCGMYTHPIFSIDGGFPPDMIAAVNKRSREEGRAWSRLPVLSDTEKLLIQGKADFLGINYYSSHLAEPSYNAELSTDNDRDVTLSIDESWPKSKSDHVQFVPEGLRELLNWLRREYNSPEMMITENGWSDDGQLQDDDRIKYINGHLQATLDAISDGCKVRAYTAWSLMDNLEWTMGYSHRFGIYHVDFDVPEKTRTPKASVAFLRNVIETRTLPN